MHETFTPVCVHANVDVMMKVVHTVVTKSLVYLQPPWVQISAPPWTSPKTGYVHPFYAKRG